MSPPGPGGRPALPGLRPRPLPALGVSHGDKQRSPPGRGHPAFPAEPAPPSRPTGDAPSPGPRLRIPRGRPSAVLEPPSEPSRGLPRRAGCWAGAERRVPRGPEGRELPAGAAPESAVSPGEGRVTVGGGLPGAPLCSHSRFGRDLAPPRLVHIWAPRRCRRAGPGAPSRSWGAPPLRCVPTDPCAPRAPLGRRL